MTEEELKKLLTKDYYGTTDLVDMKLFNSRHQLEDYMNKNLIEFNRVNKSTLFFTRDQILKFWKGHGPGSENYLTEEIKFHCTTLEKERLSDLIADLSKKFNRFLTIGDFFRHVINERRIK